MISGVSSALKLSGSKDNRRGARSAATRSRASAKGRLSKLPAERVSSTLADGLRTQSIGPINFEHIRKYVDDMVSVTEDEIRTAMRRLALNVRLIAEPSGAVTFAAWLFHAKELPESRKTVAVVSGGNVDPQLLAEVLSEASTGIE